jgi:hypothetical protein
MKKFSFILSLKIIGNLKIKFFSIDLLKTIIHALEETVKIT